MERAARSGVSETAQPVLLSLSCGVFLFLSVTGGFGPPGALIFVFAAGASMSPGLSGPEVAERVLVAAATAARSTLRVGIATSVLLSTIDDRRKPAGIRAGNESDRQGWPRRPCGPMRGGHGLRLSPPRAHPFPSGFQNPR